MRVIGRFGPVVVFKFPSFTEGACLTLSILLRIAPILGSRGRAILDEIAIEGRSLAHRGLVGRATYRECSLVGLTNGLDAGSAGILVATNGGNVVLDLNPLHRLRDTAIRNNTTLGIVVSVLNTVRCHTISWMNDRERKALAV